jgi:acetylornithine aminotransferase
MKQKHSIKKQSNNFLIQNYKKNDIAFTKGRGSNLYDINNKKYIDFASGIGVCALGHSNKKITQTIKKQSKTLLHTSNLFHIIPQIKLAKKINKLIAPSIKNAKTFFANSGAEANEGAIKIARKYGNNLSNQVKNNNNNILNHSQKYEIITLKNSFHGRTLATLKACGQTQMHIKSFAPYIDGFKYANDIEDIYNKITPKTCAVMLELIKGEGGLKALNIKQVQKLAKFLKSKNILLICDEVQTGVYRTGEFVCANLYKIKPDIITLAKGLGGGLPIGAVVTNIDNAFSYGEHGSTFGGNFLSVAVANCVLGELLKMQKNAKLDKTINQFNKQLQKTKKQNPKLISEISGIGLMRGLVIKDSSLLNDILATSLDNELILLRSGVDVVRFLPPLNISNKDIKKGFKVLNKVLKQI